MAALVRRVVGRLLAAAPLLDHEVLCSLEKLALNVSDSVALFRESLLGLSTTWAVLPLEPGELLSVQSDSSGRSFTLRVNAFTIPSAQRDDNEEWEQISVAAFDENQEFMLDMIFPLSQRDAAILMLRELLSEELALVVYERDGVWSGSRTVRVEIAKNERSSGIKYVRSWLGTHNWAPH